MDLRKQHAVATDLLRWLGLDYVLLERKNGHFMYKAWSQPIPWHNGHQTVKRGKVRV
jgi:hypothetical protein